MTKMKMLRNIMAIIANKKAVNPRQVNDPIAITANVILDFNLNADGNLIQGGVK